eukprot:6964826-Pyramimonas_sp.AAC.1
MPMLAAPSMPTPPLEESHFIPGPAVEKTPGASEGPMRGGRPRNETWKCPPQCEDIGSFPTTSTCLGTSLSPSAQSFLEEEVEAREAATTIRVSERRSDLTRRISPGHPEAPQGDLAATVTQTEMAAGGRMITATLPGVHFTPTTWT